MGFEDLFGNNDHYKRDKHHQQYRPGKYHRDEISGEDEFHSDHDFRGRGFYTRQNNIGYFLLNLRNNPKLRLLLIAGSIVLLFILLILIVVMMPLIVKVIDFIGKEGIQGVADWFTAFLDKLWKGSGK
jgi:type IV secretory pathway component VirB8